MKSFPLFKCSQITLTLLITFYVGLILNLVTYFKNAQTGQMLDILFVVLTALGICAFVFMLLTLIAFLGEVLYKTMASLLVFFIGLCQLLYDFL